MFQQDSQQLSPLTLDSSSSAITERKQKMKTAKNKFFYKRVTFISLLTLLSIVCVIAIYSFPQPQTTSNEDVLVSNLGKVKDLTNLTHEQSVTILSHILYPHNSSILNDFSDVAFL